MSEDTKQDQKTTTAQVGGEPGTDWAGPTRKEIEEGPSALRGTGDFEGKDVMQIGSDNPSDAPSNDEPQGGTVGVANPGDRVRDRTPVSGNTTTPVQEEPSGI